MQTLTASDTMSIALAGGKTTNNLTWMVSYWDADPSSAALVGEGNAQGQTNGTTSVQMLAAPATGRVRHPRAMVMSNTDTAPATATIMIGTATFRVQLAVGDTLQMTERDGFFVTDATGATKNATTTAWGSLTGTLTSQSDLNSALTAKANASDVTTSLSGKADLVNGTVPTAQLPLATTGANGAQSAADKAKQDTQAPGGWASSVANQIAALVPALTEPFTPVRLAGNPSAWPTGLSDAGVHKGAGQGIATTWIALTESVVVNPAAVPWAVAFLCTFPTPATSGANGAYLALVNIGHASYFGFLSVQAIDGTHLVIQCGNGVGNSRQVTSYVIDGNEHTWILAFDGTNLKVQIDGALVATIASTNFVSVPTDNFWLGMYNNTANQIKIRAYGWGV